MKQKSFTLIELRVTTAQQNCFSKNTNTTSLRPAGRTSRLTQSSSSHLHTPKAFFTQSAFTLIELLVVIAIIAILAAMLMPALQKARMKSVTSDCQSREKQLGVVFAFYADDNSDWLPGRYISKAYYGANPSKDGSSWQNMLGTAGYLKYQGMSTGIKRENILACPAALKATAGTNFGLNTSLRTQALNTAAKSRGVWNISDPFIKRGTVKKPSSVALLGDSNETTYQIDPSQAADEFYPIGANFTRHQGINMLFIDGHVEFMQKDEVRYWKTTAIRFSKPWFY
ncbi:MAG: prepilin-type N-terminal cleavage/methylation domain-containing protein [Lentisphaeria bacterium]|nr:prepilin-type N-terminal cleavage/methylation domain-containing protein [Lentisphaeria bacterium]